MLNHSGVGYSIYLRRVEEGHVGVYFRGGAMLNGMASTPSSSTVEVLLLVSRTGWSRLPHDAAFPD